MDQTPLQDKTDQIDASLQVLEQGQLRGLQRESVEALAAHLESSAQVAEQSNAEYRHAFEGSLPASSAAPQNSKNPPKTKPNKPGNSPRKFAPHQDKNPSPQEINTLVALFTDGRHADAATLAQSMTERFPLHGFGWKALGAVYKRMGRSADALAPMQKAAALSPSDADALSNLGVTLHDLGRLDEAVGSYCRALEIKPDFAEAHCNLATTLQDMGRLGEAEASCRRALEIKPGYAKAYSNLGNALRDMGRLDEAEASYRQALEINPDLAEAHYNLGDTFCVLDDLGRAAVEYHKTLTIDPNNIGLEAAVYLAILYYLEENYEQSRSMLLASQPIINKDRIQAKNSRSYWLYLAKLLSWTQQTNQNNNQKKGMRTLHVIGESHALTAHGMVVRYNGQEMRCAAEWIVGCKQWHLGNSKENKYKHKFAAVMARLPRGSIILLTVGEIDCRHDEGIIKAWKKYPGKTLDEVMQSTVEGYINYVAAIAGCYGHRIIVGGVPAPNILLDGLTAAEVEQLVRLIRIFNAVLKKLALAAGMRFLDVYALTDRGDGIASGAWHIDDIHLLSSAVVEAFDRMAIREPSPQEMNTLMELFTEGRYQEAATLAQAMTERYPAHGFGWKALGAVFTQMGRNADALAPLQKAVELSSSDPEAHYNLGNALKNLGRLDEAEASYREALVIRQDYADAHSNLGNTLLAIGRLCEAEASYQQALQVKPDFADALSNLSLVVKALGRLGEAESYTRQALQIKPDSAEAHNNMGNILKDLGRLDDAEASYQRALQIKPNFVEAHSNLLLIMNYVSCSASYYLEASRRYGQMVADKVKTRFSGWTCSPHPVRLRVGLVSGDMRNHPVGHFLESTLAHIDPARIELFAYSTHHKADELTARIKPRFSEWRSLVGMGDEAAVQLIHSDGIHVLVDISGHTDYNRLPVFARKPAPVQVSWLGYFASTGVAEMDYLLADEVGVPESHRGHFTESVWYLPETRLCFTPPDSDVAVGHLPALDNGYITFGCFQNLAKVGDEVIAAWRNILAALPSAKLRLQCKQLGDLSVANRLAQRLQQHGIDVTRVSMHGAASRDAYLASHAAIDLILDTFPYPGGTTTCEALWMGVPTLTLAGDRLLSRQGASILTAAGLENWVAVSEADYVAKAVALASDVPMLAALRAGLRQQALASTVFDAPRFARNFEAALWGMWQERNPIREPAPQALDALVTLFNQRRYAELEPFAQMMTARFPSHGFAWMVLGAALKLQGRVAEALVPMQQAAELLPGNADAHHNLGITLKGQGRLIEAEACYRRVLQIKPDYAEAHANLGVALKDQGKLAEADASLRRALALKPDYAEAYSNLGVILKDQGKLAEAEGCLRRALAIRPEMAEAHGNLGNTLKVLGRLAEAEASYRRALEIKPGYAEAHSNLGITLKELGRLDEAEASYRRALQVKPDYAEAHSNLGNIFKEQERFSAAEACYRRALEIKPDYVEAHSNLGIILKEQGRYAEAEASYLRALEIKPDFAEGYSNLGVTLKDQGRLLEAEASYRRALALKPDFAEAQSNLLFTLNFNANPAPSACLEEARTYGRMVADKVKMRFSDWTCSPHPERLRVGLVSGDLHNHPVGYFLESILAHLDPARIELFAYATYHKEDDLTARIRPHFAAWRSLLGLTDEMAASLIHADGVHVLLDLSGHTAHNRLPVFAWKPAPVQASWLGYFATTGVAEVDYLLADETGILPEQRDQFTEAIWYLPDTRLCFTAPPTNLPVSPLPALAANGSITFGCFQNLAKLGNGVLAAWAKILSALPDALLRLQCKPLGDHAVMEQLVQRLSLHGIDPARVSMHGQAAREAYLAAHAEVDMILDTFPYPGGTTTCEALWMGVPTLTLVGERLLSRQGASLLMAAGLAEWVATSEADYVAKAIALAGDVPKLAALRAGLRAQALESPLFDATRFARNFEAALWGMWQAK